MTPSTILITGGAGFIGSAVIRHLIRHTGHLVVNLDKLTYAGNLESLVEVADSSRYIFEHADITDRSALDRIFARHRPGSVMHLAAESHVDRSIDGPGEFIHTNMVGTYTLLEASRAYWGSLDESGKERFRFHHISTDEVYVLPAAYHPYVPYVSYLWGMMFLVSIINVYRVWSRNLKESAEK